MFTGIIQHIATVKSFSQNVLILTLPDQMNIAEVSIGDSVAVSGCCLTVTKISQNPHEFEFYLSDETIHTVNEFVAGEVVNIELAMQAKSFFGGHVVSGHVDDVATITRLVQDENNAWDLEIKINTAKFLVDKGSVTVDGISLTVNSVDEEKGIIAIKIIPHTFENTNIQFKGEGSKVNIEYDVMAKYVAKYFDKMHNK